ncbi:MAG: hypothetical protein ACMXX6_01100 [Candidatus Woesearchaeota archaeon]
MNKEKIIELTKKQREWAKILRDKAQELQELEDVGKLNEEDLIDFEKILKAIDKLQYLEHKALERESLKKSLDYLKKTMLETKKCLQDFEKKNLLKLEQDTQDLFKDSSILLEDLIKEIN